MQTKINISKFKFLIILIFYLNFKDICLGISKIQVIVYKIKFKHYLNSSQMNDLQFSQNYTSSLRYSLAKNKLDNLFLKWLRSNREQAQMLLIKAQTGKLKAQQLPNPLFSHHKVPHQITNSSLISSVPRPSLESSTTINNSSRFMNEQSNKKLINNESQINKSVNLSKTIKPEVSSQRIPQFYFPQGRMIDTAIDANAKNTINSMFGTKNQIQVDCCKKLVTELIGLPNYFSACLMAKCANQKKITKIQFNRIWKQLQSISIQKRAFQLLSCQKNKKYITVDDLKKFFKQILQVHPGLEFLKESPEFQDWYAICVINRIFFMANKKNDYQMSYREFKKSRVLQSLFQIESEPDINLNKDFFSYQDFYVIYIKFWELDSDHDFLLSKQELSKYSGYTLSRKTIERIFSQVGRKFQHPQKMTFGDFSWFIYCVEDKTTEQSIEFWFKILDLDNNGIVAGYQLEFFFQEQSQRLAYMDANNTEFNFQNIVCQMMDLLTPKNNTQFQLEDFLKKRKQCGLFINFLTDLNKLVAFDQRDAYQQKNQKTEHPEWTQWDRFVKPEYKRVENAGQCEQGQQMLNWQDDA